MSIITAPPRLINPYCLEGCLAHTAIFDGTNDYLLRSSDFNENIDGSKGFISFWYSWNTTSPIEQRFYSAKLDHVKIFRSISYKIRFELTAANGVDRFIFETANPYGNLGIAEGVFIHVMAAWNTNYGPGLKHASIFINDVYDTAIISDAAGAFQIDYTNGNHVIGGSSSGGNLNGALAAFYLHLNDAPDLSSVENRRYFITSDKKPVSDLQYVNRSSWASGASPTVYLKHPAAYFSKNAGYGGDFSTVGALASTNGPCVGNLQTLIDIKEIGD